MPVKCFPSGLGHFGDSLVHELASKLVNFLPPIGILLEQNL